MYSASIYRKRFAPHPLKPPPFFVNADTEETLSFDVRDYKCQQRCPRYYYPGQTTVCAINKHRNSVRYRDNDNYQVYTYVRLLILLVFYCFLPKMCNDGQHLGIIQRSR